MRAASLIECNQNLAKSKDPLFSLPDQYHCLVRKLIYLTITGTELTFSVHTLAQFMQAPTSAQWNSVLRVVCYLNESVISRAVSNQVFCLSPTLRSLCQHTVTLTGLLVPLPNAL